MASTARPLLFPISATSRSCGVRALQSGFRRGSKDEHRSCQQLRLSVSGTATPSPRARIGSSSLAAHDHNRAFSTVAASAIPAGDSGGPVLPEPRRPYSQDGPFACEPIWTASLRQRPQAYYEADEYAVGDCVRHALLGSRLDTALSAYASGPRGTVLLSVSTIDQFIRALLTPRTGGPPVPAPTQISTAAEILIDQLNAHVHRPVPLPPGFCNVAIDAMRVLAALSSSTAVPFRWERVRTILQLMHVGRFPVDNHNPSRIAIAAACYGSQSHVGAISALSRDVRLSLEDWKCALGLLGRIRFDAHSFMSAEHFSSFLKLYETRGGVVDTGLFMSYVKALAIVVANVRRTEEGQNLNDMCAKRGALLARIRDTLHVLEGELLPRYAAVSRGSVAIPLLSLHLHLPHRPNDISRCWTEIMRGPPLVRSRAATVLVGFSLDTVYRLWEDLLTSDTYVPSPADWDLFEGALQRGGTYSDAVRAIFKRFCADPGLRAAEPAEESVKALLGHVPLPEGRVRGILKYLLRANASVPFQCPIIVPSL